MSARAAVILIEDGKVALIERQRLGLHYYTFPGGHIEPGESPEQTAVREALEELGLNVLLHRLVAMGRWQGDLQYYYLAESVGGTFGSGTGAELHHPFPGRGTYTPLWMPLTEILTAPVVPHPLAEMVAHSPLVGWPETVPTLAEG